MASIRARARADGTTAYAVLYKLGTVQTAVTFDDQGSAEEFKAAVESIGAERAMKAWGIGATTRVQKPKGQTLSEWIRKYIASRTGVTKATLYDYESYLKHDIEPTIGGIHLTLISRDDISTWVQGLADRELSGKTIKNRHGFLSAALNAAVKAELIPSNPALGTRLPRTETAEMCFLTPEEYALLWEGFMPRWRPMVDFMVMSGVRFGELTALKPSDVDRDRGTVYIGRAWKRTYDGDRYEIGVPKTRRSIRTINIPAKVLDALDYTNEWLFTNTAGKPISGPSFRNNVWYPAVKRAQAYGLTKKPRIHDMRHCCASWMVQDGIPLPVVQAHLGHESINTTISLYTHLDRKGAQAAADTIGKRLGGTLFGS